MEVAPGVHLVDGIAGVCCYLLVGREMALVDTGWPGSDGPVLRYIRRQGRHPGELRHILLTHGHPDHTGSATRLRELTGARVLAHAADTREGADGARWATYVSQPFAVRWRVPLFHQAPIDGTLEDGDTLDILDGLRVHHTPGHTPGSVVLHLERRGVLFTGDTLLAYGTGFSRPAPVPGYDAASYQQSLGRIARLKFDVACGGHGTPVVGGASRILNDELARGALGSFWTGLWHRVARTVSARKRTAVDTSGRRRLY